MATLVHAERVLFSKDNLESHAGPFPLLTEEQQNDKQITETILRGMSGSMLFAPMRALFLFYQCDRAAMISPIVRWRVLETILICAQANMALAKVREKKQGCWDMMFESRIGCKLEDLVKRINRSGNPMSEDSKFFMQFSVNNVYPADATRIMVRCGFPTNPQPGVPKAFPRGRDESVLFEERFAKFMEMRKFTATLKKDVIDPINRPKRIRSKKWSHQPYRLSRTIEVVPQSKPPTRQFLTQPREWHAHPAHTPYDPPPGDFRYHQGRGLYGNLGLKNQVLESKVTSTKIHSNGGGARQLLLILSRTIGLGKAFTTGLIT